MATRGIKTDRLVVGEMVVLDVWQGSSECANDGISAETRGTKM